MADLGSQHDDALVRRLGRSQRRRTGTARTRTGGVAKGASPSRAQGEASRTQPSLRRCSHRLGGDLCLREEDCKHPGIASERHHYVHRVETLRQIAPIDSAKGRVVSHHRRDKLLNLQYAGDAIADIRPVGRCLRRCHRTPAPPSRSGQTIHCADITRLHRLSRVSSSFRSRSCPIGPESLNCPRCSMYPLSPTPHR